MVHGTIILVMFSSILVLPAAGQQSDYLFHHITQPDGLLDDKVDAIAQDRRGYIWIGTSSGLQRYDGLRFMSYQDALEKDNKNLHWVTTIDTVRGDRLFLSSGWECRKLDWMTNTISPFSEADVREDALETRKYQDAINNPWTLGAHNIYKRDLASGKLYTYPRYMAEDFVRKRTWVLAAGAFLLLDDSSGRVFSPAWNPIHHPLLQAMVGKNLKGFTLDSENLLWIYSWAGELFQYNLNTGEIRKSMLLSLPRIPPVRHSGGSQTINAIYEDHYGTIWLATSGVGLLRYHRETGHFEEIAGPEKGNRGIQYNFEVFCIFQDKEDNIWIGTDRGITIFNPYHPHFKFLRHEEGTKKTLPQHEITGFIELASGNLLVCTWGGGITFFDHHLQFLRNVLFAGDNDQNLIWSLIELDGKIWAGCQHGWLHLYDLSRNQWSSLCPDALKHSTVRCMQKDSAGNIYFGLQNGKIVWWGKRDRVFHAYNDSAGGVGGAFTPVHAILIDSLQRCWVATESGLWLFDRKWGMYTAKWSPDQKSPAACLSLAEQDDSTLLVGIQRGGLSYFHKERQQFSFPFLTEKHPPSVEAIRKDAKGQIWFTTEYGLHSVGQGRYAPTSYSIEPGVLHSAFDVAGILPLRDGRWLAATTTEIVGFFPATLNGQSGGSLPVTITGLKLPEGPLFIDSFLLRNESIPLNYRQNFITIEFASLRYSNPRQITYYYRLSGVDRDWVNADNSGSAGYTNLAPGDYTLQVKAEDGSQEGLVTSFLFNVAPPIWQTWWFRTACLLSFAFVIYLLVRRRISSIRHEAELKQQIAETEMMALRAQMNPHFIFNCINSIDALIQNNDKYQATVYLNKFARLIRNILDSSRENTVPLAKDLETLQLYIELEQFRNDHRYSCEIGADEGLIQDSYRVPPLIIQPYVENAILHGLRSLPKGKGRLFISVSRQNEYLTYIVEDNGVGRKAVAAAPKLEKQSYGMQMTSDRVKLFNKENKPSVEITDLVSDGQPAGTRVKISLKIQ